MDSFRFSWAEPEQQSALLVSSYQSILQDHIVRGASFSSTAYLSLWLNSDGLCPQLFINGRHEAVVIRQHKDSSFKAIIQRPKLLLCRLTSL